MDDAAYEAKSIELENELKPFLTDKFLSDLVKAARTCGWNVDHVETTKFVKWCFDIAEKKQPENLLSFMNS